LIKEQEPLMNCIGIHCKVIYVKIQGFFKAVYCVTCLNNQRTTEPNFWQHSSGDGSNCGDMPLTWAVITI